MQAPLTSLLFPYSTGELDHRSRLMEAMAECLGERAYGAITIADVVRRAHVSKRTFYEHFSDKEECYLATYATAGSAILERIAEAAQGVDDPEERLWVAVRTYLGLLEVNRALTRSFLTEIQSLGPRGLAVRRDVFRRFAQQVRERVEQGHAQDARIRPLSAQMATAVVGGIHEMVLEEFESGDASFATVADTAFELVRALVLAPEPGPLTPRG